MKEIQPIAIPGIHERFLPFFLKNIGNRRKVLDAGAGHGAMSRKLHELGFQVTALDFNKELYQCKEVPFVEADLTQSLPFPDASFEIIIAVEVWEHITCQQRFLQESMRVLKPGGLLFISTPNILSLKSRFRFLFTGFFYSFKPLEINLNDGLQHISSQSYDQIVWMASLSGFQLLETETDKKQNTSRALMIFYPFILLINILRKSLSRHNQKTLLLGRILFFRFIKPI